MQQHADIFNSTFKYAKKTAKRYYFKQWAKVNSRCPAFEGEVVNIGREGWEHTVKIVRRTKMDVLGRLFCLEYARSILDTATSFQEYTRNKKAGVEFWVFTSIVGATKVSVVVRSVNNGRKHFYSVIRKGSIEADLEQ